VTQGTYGSVVVNQDGTITYTPNTSFTGVDSFTYTVEDPDENEATGTVTVSVGPIDPVALDGLIETAVDTAVIIDAANLAQDPEGGSLEVISVTQGEHGTVVINQDGTLTYTPDDSFSGEDSFEYTVEDEDSNTSTATITVQVGPSDDDETEVEVMSDIEDMSDELENWTSTSAATLLSVSIALAPNITGYTNQVNTFIEQHPLAFPVATHVAIYGVLQKHNERLSRIANALDAMLVANKARIEVLSQQAKVAMAAGNPNINHINGILKEILNASKAHNTVASELVKVLVTWKTSWALAKTYGDSIGQTFQILLPGLTRPWPYDKERYRPMKQ
jgi:VCBS repeat-containing protein